MPDALKVTAPSDREAVMMTRVFDAPRSLVFDCFTKPDLVKRWLLGPPGWIMPVCEIDFRVGGKWRYVWRNDKDGSEFGMNGVFREIVSSARVVHTEIYNESESLVTTEFSEEKGRTTVVITMLFATREARDAAVATGMSDGVEASYVRLDEILALMPPRETAKGAA